MSELHNRPEQDDELSVEELEAAAGGGPVVIINDADGCGGDYNAVEGCGG